MKALAITKLLIFVAAQLITVLLRVCFVASYFQVVVLVVRRRVTTAKSFVILVILQNLAF